MDTLTQQALNWALTHIRRFGDTDILPGAFEFAAVAHAWTWLRIELESRDLAIYGLRPHRYLLVPKPGGGFRVVVQLDPLDTIVYTALVYEMAELIERHRIPAAQRVACSYRIQLDDKGSFFGPDNGWRDFHGRFGGRISGGVTSNMGGTIPFRRLVRL